MVLNMEGELKARIAALPPWREGDLSQEEWNEYLTVARHLQESDPDTVESVLAEFIELAAKEEFRGYESESKAFLLMRVIFDLPEAAPEAERKSFKGWVNWPAADSRGEVSVAWPLSWKSGRPRLVSAYEGSEGVRYAATSEYRHFRARYPYRDLSSENKHG